jgi:hypothetical protein
MFSRRKSASDGHGVSALLGGMLTGATAMYFLDAQSGGRRRAFVRDKAVHARHVVEQASSDVEHDIQNRARGFVARVDNALRPRRVPDETLVERVRAKLGHVCSHPNAIEVRAKGDAIIELKGDILASERLRVLALISAVAGVRKIDDDLRVHEAADIPSLQGEAPRVNFVRRHWNPTTRFLIGATGAVIILDGLIDGRGRLLRTLFGGAMIGTAIASNPTAGYVRGKLQTGIRDVRQQADRSLSR